MGFGLEYYVIEDKPALLEVLHETDDEVISIIISGGTGDRLKALPCDVTNIAMHQSYYSHEFDPKSIKAVIPIEVGDYIVTSRLFKKHNNLDILCCPIRFIDGGWASGEEAGITVNDVSKIIDEIMNRNHQISNNNKFDYSWYYNNPTLLLSIFNVINPRNAVTYHLIPEY